MKRLLENKTIIIVGIIIILLAIAVVILVNQQKESTPEKQSLKEQTVENFRITNSNITEENGTYTLHSNIENTTEEEQYVKLVNIDLKDKDDNTLLTLVGYVDSTIEVNGSRTITSSTNLNLYEVEKFVYSINK